MHFKPVTRGLVDIYGNNVKMNARKLYRTVLPYFFVITTTKKIINPNKRDIFNMKIISMHLKVYF